MTTAEKIALIRHHAEKLSHVGYAMDDIGRNAALGHAQRLQELIKDIPEAEWPAISEGRFRG